METSTEFLFDRKVKILKVAPLYFNYNGFTNMKYKQMNLRWWEIHHVVLIHKSAELTSHTHGCSCNCTNTEPGE